MLADIPSFSELISTAEIKAVDYPGVYASRYSSLAGLVIFLYDIFLTFPDEVCIYFDFSYSANKIHLLFVG